MPSSTSCVAAVPGACCRMSSRLGRRSTTTSGFGASTVPRRDYIPPCAIVYECASRENPNLVRVYSGFPIGKDYRGRRRTRLRRRKEGKGTKASLAGGHRGPGAQGESPCSQRGGPGGNRDAARACQGVVSAPLAPMAGRRLQGRETKAEAGWRRSWGGQ